MYRSQHHKTYIKACTLSEVSNWSVPHPPWISTNHEVFCLKILEPNSTHRVGGRDGKPRFLLKGGHGVYPGFSGLHAYVLVQEFEGGVKPTFVHLHSLIRASSSWSIYPLIDGCLLSFHQWF